MRTMKAWKRQVWRARQWVKVVASIPARVNDLENKAQELEDWAGKHEDENKDTEREFDRELNEYPSPSEVSDHIDSIEANDRRLDEVVADIRLIARQLRRKGILDPEDTLEVGD